jgi:hypothetical protein
LALSIRSSSLWISFFSTSFNLLRTSHSPLSYEIKKEDEKCEGTKRRRGKGQKKKKRKKKRSTSAGRVFRSSAMAFSTTRTLQGSEEMDFEQQGQEFCSSLQSEMHSEQ